VSQLKIIDIIDFSGETFKDFWSAILVLWYECNDDTTVLQQL